MGVLLLFIDGVGLGNADPAVNPLLRAHLPHLTGLMGGPPLAASVGEPRAVAPDLWARAADARLGVPGLPQSATGQTTILTGVNAAAAIGRHLNAYPTPNLRRILGEHSVFKQVLARGRRAAFLNAYRPEFFHFLDTMHDRLAQDMTLPERDLAAAEAAAEAGLSGEATADADARVRAAQAAGPPGAGLFGKRRRDISKKYRPSASTVAALAAGLSFRTYDDLLAGNAIYHDLTHWTAQDHPQAPPLIDPAEAGRRAASLMATADFAMQEHFLTDFAGHRQEMAQAVQVLEIYDAFLGGVLQHLDRERHLVILTSDHGNIEDLSVKTHTYNPVPVLCAGRGAEAACRRIADLTGVTPAILAALG